MLIQDKRYLEVSGNLTPWLISFVPDADVFGAHFAHQVSQRSAVAFKYSGFSMGTISVGGETIFVGHEHVFQGNYALALSPHLSLGIAGRYYMGSYYIGNGHRHIDSYGGDVGMRYQNVVYERGATKWNVQFGAAVLQMAQKINAFSFMPANLQTGAMLGFNHEGSALTIKNHTGYQFTKMLVPSPPALVETSMVQGQGYPEIRPGYSMVSGYDPNVSMVQGMIRSFYDAPGVVTKNDDGSYSVEKGSRFREEVSEYIHQIGNEFELKPGDNLSFFFRQGLFLEADNKGARKFVSLGLGARVYGFTLDVGGFVWSAVPTLKRTVFASVGYRYQF